MAISFERGANLGPTDLFVYIRDGEGNFVDPLIVTYEVFFDDPNEKELVPMASMVKEIVKYAVGKYYAPLNIAFDAPIGTYVIRWTLKRDDETNMYAVENKFNVKKMMRC